MLLTKSLYSHAPAWTILIRFMVGFIFFFEGLQKFIFADILGAGRFETIGIPWPQFTGPFVGAIETVCGLLILLGLLTRLAAIPLIITMIVAIITTKIPILLGHDLGIFMVKKLPQYGFWSMEHEMRADFSMLMGSLFLLIVGAGRWSLDACWYKRRSSGRTV